MLTAFLIAFNATVTTISKHKGFSFLVVLILLCFAIASGNADGMKLLTDQVTNPNIEKNRFNNSLQADNQIMVMMERTRAAINADRLLVRQFRNGTKDLAGIPFMRIQTTYVAMKDDVVLPPDAYLPFPKSTMNRTLLEMWFDRNRKPKCVIGLMVDSQDQSYRDYLARYGVVKHAACPILSGGNPVGIVGVGFLSIDNVSDEIIISKLSALALNVSLNLQSVDYVEPEDERSWFKLW